MSHDDFEIEGPQAEPMLDATEQPDGRIQVTMTVMPPHSEDIANAIAQRLASNYGTTEALKKLVAERFDALIRNAVDTHARVAIEKALHTPFQPTDRFGAPTGEAKSFAQVIQEQVDAWQNETVDPRTGAPKEKSYHSTDVITRREYLIRQAGGAEFSKMATEAVAAIRTDAKAKIENSIKTAVADSLAKLVPAK